MKPEIHVVNLRSRFYRSWRSLYFFSPILRSFTTTAEVMVRLCIFRLSICGIRATSGPSH